MAAALPQHPVYQPQVRTTRAVTPQLHFPNRIEKRLGGVQKVTIYVDKIRSAMELNNSASSYSVLNVPGDSLLATSCEATITG